MLTDKTLFLFASSSKPPLLEMVAGVQASVSWLSPPTHTRINKLSGSVSVYSLLHTCTVACKCQFYMPASYLRPKLTLRKFRDQLSLCAEIAFTVELNDALYQAIFHHVRCA